MQQITNTITGIELLKKLLFVAFKINHPTQKYMRGVIYDMLSDKMESLDSFSIFAVIYDICRYE